MDFNDVLHKCFILVDIAIIYDRSKSSMGKNTNSKRKAHVKKKQTQKRNLKQNQPSHDTFKEKN